MELQVTELQRFLRRREVEAITGLSCSNIYAKMAARTFPQSVKLAPGTVVWLERDIAEWQAQEVAKARGVQPLPRPNGAATKLSPKIPETGWRTK